MEKMLFTSKTCKYCIPAKEILKNTEDVLVKDISESEDLVIKYGIRSVPTLVTNCTCEGVKKYIGVNEIEEFVNNLK